MGIKIDYFGPVSSKISDCLNQTEYRTAFKTNYSILDNIRKVTDKIKKGKGNIGNSKNVTGVYRLYCNSCKKIYIEETERSINCRVNEDMTLPSSNVFKHIKAENHQMKEIKILHKNRDRKMLRVLEKYEITKAVKGGEELLNVQKEVDLATNPLYIKCAAISDENQNVQAITIGSWGDGDFGEGDSRGAGALPRLAEVPGFPTKTPPEHSVNGH
ncbi:unnamed protein product [Bemisia tabaci]|uniref:Uncharacterized protein n=1 Tax=Bemisia tabaci TaxID=7038 RepID=A0A9P0A6W5_BEMTA|nr:unnamed protein product [Bemisia tabaci]